MEDEKIPGDRPGNDAKRMADKFEKSAHEFKEEAHNSYRQAKEEWNNTTNSGDNKRILAGVLALILGTLGIHKFILGYTKEGVILLVLGLLGIFTCGITSSISAIIGIIEGIIYLTKTEEDFYNTYQAGNKPWF